LKAERGNSLNPRPDLGNASVGKWYIDLMDKTINMRPFHAAFAEMVFL